MAWPLVELSGLLDPNVFVTGYTPTGVDVGAEISQVLNKVNETIVGANDLKVDLDAEVSAGLARDGRLDTHDTLIQSALNASSNNTNDINLLEVHAAGDGSDHADVAQNSADIATINSEIGLGTATITGDMADFTFAEYGGYNRFILNKDASLQTVVLTSPLAGSWPVNRTVTFFCDASYGALVSSTSFTPWGSAEIFLEFGDSLTLTVVDVTTGKRWLAMKHSPPHKRSHFKELAVTEAYVLGRQFDYKQFVVSGQSAAQEATVTLPAITSEMVGTELKGFHHGADGDLTFTCGGTDNFLLPAGLTDTSVSIGESGTDAIAIRLTALPAVSGVYYWAAEMDT